MRFLGITILTGCLSAVYPALYLSSLKTLNIIKRSAGSDAPKSQFRKALVVAQFSLSIIFIIGTIVIFSQMEYIRKKDLGYNRSDLLYLPIPGERMEIVRGRNFSREITSDSSNYIFFIPKPLTLGLKGQGERNLDSLYDLINSI